MLHSFPRRLGAWLGALLLAAGLLINGSAPAEATTRPTSVTLSPTADPAHSQTFTWRMTKNRSGQVVQVKAPNGKVTTAGARYKMRVQKKYSGIDAYAFTATATKLAPGTRYAYPSAPRAPGWTAPGRSWPSVTPRWRTPASPRT